MSAQGITDELVHQVADDLRARMASTTRTCVRSDRGWPRRPEREAPRILEFAKRFTEERRETFDRLAE